MAKKIGIHSMQFLNYWFTMKCRVEVERALATIIFGKICILLDKKKKKKAPITGPTFPVEPGKRQHPDKLEFTLSGWGSATARIHSSSNQGVEEGMPLLPNRQIFLFPDLGSIGLEVFVLKEGILLPDNTAMVSLNWQVRQPLGHFVLGMPQNQKAKRVVTVLAGVSNPDFQGEIGLFS